MSTSSTRAPSARRCTSTTPTRSQSRFWRTSMPANAASAASPNTRAELVRAMATERGVGVDAGDYARFLRELDVLG